MSEEQMKQREELKLELAVMDECYSRISVLSVRARTRVLDWVMARLEEDRDKGLEAQVLGRSPK